MRADDRCVKGGFKDGYNFGVDHDPEDASPGPASTLCAGVDGWRIEFALEEEEGLENVHLPGKAGDQAGEAG